MRELTSTVPVNTSTQLLDKYMLPKVALTVITLASAVGTYLTMSTHGANGLVPVGIRWLHLLGYAAMAGGFMWLGVYLRHADKPSHEKQVQAFVAGSVARFRRVVQVALPVFLVGGAADVWRFDGWLTGRAGSWLVWPEVALLVALALVAGRFAYGRLPDDAFGSQRLARVAVGLLMVDALVQAAFDVTLAQGGQLLALGVRWPHLAAFGLWFGGAVWNIFIAVPAARKVVSIPVVVASSQHLERFRVAVRIILPTLLITGLIQAYPYVGLSPTALIATTFGRLILFKMFLIVVLVAVFITCPMWRACSPIAGMCNLDDLYAPKSET